MYVVVYFWVKLLQYLHICETTNVAYRNVLLETESFINGKFSIHGLPTVILRHTMQY